MVDKFNTWQCVLVLKIRPESFKALKGDQKEKENFESVFSKFKNFYARSRLGFEIVSFMVAVSKKRRECDSNTHKMVFDRTWEEIPTDD